MYVQFFKITISISLVVEIYNSFGFKPIRLSLYNPLNGYKSPERSTSNSFDR